MTMRKLILFLLLIPVFSFAQNLDRIKGKVLKYDTIYINKPVSDTSTRILVLDSQGRIRYNYSAGGSVIDSLPWYHNALTKATTQRYPGDSLLVNSIVGFKSYGLLQSKNPSSPNTDYAKIWLHGINGFLTLSAGKNNTPPFANGRINQTFSPGNCAVSWDFYNDTFGYYMYQLDEYGFYPTMFSTKGTYNQYLGIPSYHWKRAYIDTINYTTLYPAIPAASWTVSGTNQYSAVSGNVGIGTNTPSAKLGIVSTLTANGIDVAAASGHGIYATSNYGTGIYATSKYSYGVYAENNTSGGGGVYGSAISGRGGYFISSSGTGLEVLSFSGTALKATTSSGYAGIFMGGNVGIGITNPSVLLDVAGAIKGINGAGIAITGSTSSNGIGVKGNATGSSGIGIDGYSAVLGTGVRGGATTGTAGSFTTSGTGTGLYVKSTAGYAALFETGNVGIGTTSPTTALDVNGTVTAIAFNETSARRFKKDISPMKSQLANVLKLNPVDYVLIQTGKKEKGFIADEVLKIYPEFADENGVNYSKMVSVLVKAIQEQQVQINELKREIKKLK